MARRSFSVTGTNNGQKQVSVDWTNELARVVSNVPLTPFDFGAVGDGVTDDSAAFVAAIDYLKTNAANDAGIYKGSNRLFIPAGHYYLGTTTLDITHTLIIEGEGSGQAGGVATKLRWAANTPGIRIQRYNTSGAGTLDGASHYAGDATILSGLYLKGAYAGAEAEAHGIHLKARATIRDVFVTDFEGDGIHIVATSGGGAPIEGNANNFKVQDCSVYNCRNGLFVDGADVNAGHVFGMDVSANRQAGIYDSSFLGNTYVACHAADNALVPNSQSLCSYGGNIYFVLLGQEAWCSTNPPSGTTADNQGWKWIQIGAPNPVSRAWVSGMAWRVGGAYVMDGGGGNARNVVLGCYSEGGQVPSVFGAPTLVLGGIHAAGIYHIDGGVFGGQINGEGAQINVPGTLLVGKDLQFGTGAANGYLTPIGGGAMQWVAAGLNLPTNTGFGGIALFSAAGLSMKSGAKINVNGDAAADTSGLNPRVTVYDDATNIYGMDLGYVAGSFCTRLFAPSARSISFGGFSANPTLQSHYTEWGSVDANGLNLKSGSVFKINGTQVVGAQGAAVADATDAASTTARLNDLLARLRTHGLIAT